MQKKKKRKEKEENIRFQLQLAQFYRVKPLNKTWCKKIDNNRYIASASF